MKSSSPLLFAPAFRHQRMGWLFVSIVAIMVYIATFAMAAEAVLSSLSLGRNQELANHLTVEIPAAGDESSTPQAERVKQAVALLRGTAGVGDVKPMSEEDTERLLAPWISEPDLLKKLPLPALIDITRADGSSITAPALEDKVRAAVSDARVDDHAAWLSDLAHLVRSLAMLSGLMVALTGLTLALAIGLVCRAVMATEHETVELLHIMGAPDANIARHFQSHAWRLAWPAALAGFLCAVLSLAVLLFLIRHVVDISALQMMHWIGIGLLVVLVPCAAALAAAFSARFSVIRLLQSFP